MLAGYLEDRLAGHPPQPPALDVRRSRAVTLEAPGSQLHLDDELVEAAADRSPQVATTGDRLTVLVPASPAD